MNEAAKPAIDRDAPAATPDRAGDRGEQLMRTCPNCGRQLEERKCKLFCPEPRCGYFLSCADYY